MPSVMWTSFTRNGERVNERFTSRRQFPPLVALLVTLLPVTFVGCGGGRTENPTAPTPTTTSGPRWTINSDPSSNHAAQFVDMDGAVLDFWSDASGNISDLRVRKVGQNPAYLKLDSIGRLVYLGDPAGIRLWVNQYFADGTVDISVSNGNGESWRAVVDLPTAGSIVTGLSGERTSQLHAPTSVHTLSARTDQLIRTADEFCNSAVLQMIGAVEGVLCAHAAAVAVISHGVALPWAIFKCGGFVAGQIVEQLICTYVRNAAASASDPTRVTTGLLPVEPDSPIPAPPSLPAPTANPDTLDIAISPEGTGVQYSTVFSFEAVGEGGQFQWNFGDGDTASGSNVKHIYRRSGTFEVTVEAQWGGQRATATKTVSVKSLKGHWVGTVTGHRGVPGFHPPITSFDLTVFADPNPADLVTPFGSSVRVDALWVDDAGCRIERGDRYPHMLQTLDVSTLVGYDQTVVQLGFGIEGHLCNGAGSDFYFSGMADDAFNVVHGDCGLRGSNCRFRMERR